MEQLDRETRTGEKSEEDRNHDRVTELDRINFAIALRDLGMFIDFEDWDGLSDLEALGLVCAHYPRHAESIVTIWEFYSNPEARNEV